MQKQNIKVKGAKIYSPLVLKLYDWWVLGISNRFAWQCPTKEVLLPFFQQYLSERHLDVGVGTGYYLARSAHHPNRQITLMDLNPNSLAATQKRLLPKPSQAVQHNVLQAVDPALHGQFDSISLFYLWHCLPDQAHEKSQMLAHMKPLLRPEGTLYGATILGDAAAHNAFGQKLMAVYNKKGIFGNRRDTEHSLRAALKAHFHEVNVTVHGKVALFVAQKPIA